MIRKIDRFLKMKSILALILLMPCLAFADHYYGGYINYTHVGGYTYHVQVITYADNDKVNSDRDSIKIKWGDGEEEWIHRTNNLGNGETVYPGVKKNIYEQSHTYTAEDNYQIVFQDQFRMFDVTNLSPGKSGTTVLYFDAIVAVSDTLSYCINTSTKTIFEPYMWVKSGEPFQMNLTHYDVEGDSLSFKLINPKALNAISVPGYWEPSDVSLDVETGLFKWDNPVYGIYIFAYEVAEYRDGVQIGHAVVDFPIFVDGTQHERGFFTAIENTTDGEYSFNGTGSEDFMVSYENSVADSVFIQVDGGYNSSLYFNGTEQHSSTGTTAFDTLSLNYVGNDKQQGGHIITFKAGSVFGSDTIYDFASFLVRTASDTTWGCTVPPNIKDVKKIAPDIPTLTISPNLFKEEAWINLGNSYADMSVEIFDTRGRLIQSHSDFQEQNVRFDTKGLRCAMYYFRVWRKEEIVTTLKAVKN